MAIDIYTIGQIYAISREYIAPWVFLNKIHKGPEYVSEHDNNNYTLGRIGKHNVVIVVLLNEEYGTDLAIRVVRDVLHSFPNIRIGLMVGIGGNGLSQNHDICLGDTVVSSPNNEKGSIFEYNYRKTI